MYVFLNGFTYTTTGYTDVAYDGFNAWVIDSLRFARIYSMGGTKSETSIDLTSYLTTADYIVKGGDKMYVFEDNSSSINFVEIDIATQTYVRTITKATATYCEPMYAHNKIWFVLHSSARGSTDQQTLFYYDLTDDTWSTAVLIPGKHQTDRRKIVWANGNFVFVAGRNENCVYKFNSTDGSYVSQIITNRKPSGLIGNTDREVLISSMDGMITTAFQDDYYAELTLGESVDNKVRFIADTLGALGNDVSIKFEDPGGNNIALLVTVSGNDINVRLKTNGSGTIVSTATEVKNAVNAKVEADALVDTTTIGTGSDIVIAHPLTYLGGGGDVDTYSNDYALESVAESIADDGTYVYGITPFLSRFEKRSASDNFRTLDGDTKDYSIDFLAGGSDISFQKVVVTRAYTHEYWDGNSIVTTTEPSYIIILRSDKCYIAENDLQDSFDLEEIRSYYVDIKGAAVIGTGAQVYSGETT